MTEVIGVSPLELDRITLFWPLLGRDATDPVLVVTAVDPFNEARVLKSLNARPVFGADLHRFNGRRSDEALPMATKEAVPEPKTVAPLGPRFRPAEPPLPAKLVEPNPAPSGATDTPSGAGSPCSARTDDVADPLFYALERGAFSALIMVDEHTLMFLPGRWDGEFTRTALLAAAFKKGATGPLADALATAGRHTLAAGVYLPPLVRDFDRRADPGLVPYTALFATRTATLTGDLKKSAKLALTLKYDDATAAKRAAPVLEEGIATVTMKVEAWAAEMRDSPRPFEKAAAPVVTVFASALKKAPVKADGSTVRVTAEVDIGPATAKALGDLLQAVQSRRKAELRTRNLKQIGVALHHYLGSHSRFPANVYGPKGELLLSWRVQLLPYLEEEALFKQFKLDEPWDGPNNKLLIEKMPEVFRAPDREHEKGKTFYLGFVEREKRAALVGRPWLKNGEKFGLTAESFTDGLSNTLAVIEAAEGVVWSKPDDLPFGGVVPLLGEKDWERTPALRFDGSVLLFPTKLRPYAFWPHVTVDGGEVTPDLGDDRRGPFGHRTQPYSGRGVESPTPVKDPIPVPLPVKETPLGAVRRAEVRLAVARAQEQLASVQTEATVAVLSRLEQLAAKGVVTREELARAQAVRADQQAHLEAARREVAKLEAELKAAKEKEASGK
ncbi:MAG TPA: DUF1559 domain-containing protein [Gemmata sp.]